MNRARGLVKFIGDVYFRFARDAGSFLAATISYYALFSIFPMFLLAISAAGYFLERPGSTEAILEYTKTVLPQFSGVVRTNVESIAATRGSAGIVGIVALVWIGTAVFGALEYALDRVWKVPVARHFFFSKLLGVAGVITVILLLILTTLMSTGFEAFQVFWRDTFAGSQPPLAAQRATASLAGWTITFLALSIIYSVVPNLKLRWRDVWVGAAFATISMELAKRIFVLYTTNLARFNAIYGSVGVIVGLLFWLYIIGNVLVLGAEVSAELKARKDAKDARSAG